MEYSCVDTLEYLLKIKSEKKKKDPSKIERDQFCAAWTKLAASEGYSERAERYLYNGVSYCGAKPFKHYLDQLENKEQGLQAFFTGKMYGNNAETTFRLVVNLFALLLNDKKTAHLVAAVIVRFPRACFNKDKKRLGNIEGILLNYFFAELTPNVELIPLVEVGVKKPVFITDFIAAMQISLEKIDTSKLSKNKVANIAKVQTWIDEYQQAKIAEENNDEISTEKTASTSTKDSLVEVVAPAVTTPVAAPTITPAVPVTEPVTQVQPIEEVKNPVIQTAADDVPPVPAEERPADMTAYLVDLLSKAGKAAAAVKAEGVQQKIKAEALIQELESEREKLQRANQRIAEQQDTIADLRKKLAAAEGDIFVLKQDVALRDAVIAERETEIAERIKMADVLSRDRSKQADESLQRLASKIRVEYRDFADALDIPMSCDLGENLRLQLQSIFDILEKGGMKIK